jgi:ABC-type Mn2+/Zn2+ transport system ATPase subunit
VTIQLFSRRRSLAGAALAAVSVTALAGCATLPVLGPNRVGNFTLVKVILACARRKAGCACSAGGAGPAPVGSVPQRRSFDASLRSAERLGDESVPVTVDTAPGAEGARLPDPGRPLFV